MKNTVGIYYFRSLYSQSACSLSVGRFSDYLMNRGYEVKLQILKSMDYIDVINIYEMICDKDVIIYKTNYKDFEYGIRLFENIMKNIPNKKFYVIGPFAVMNKDRILKKYDFITGIFNIQKSDEINNYFPKLNINVSKNTIINGIDREIEFSEKGKYINLEASSGCIYNCAFCHIRLMNYEKYEKDVDNLVNEIDYLVNKLGKKYLIFNDSVFWKNQTDNKRINELIEKIKIRKIKFYFMIYLSLTVKIPEELLIKLKEIGLIRVFFGVENISTDFIKNNNKYVSATDTEEFILKLNNLNISYHIGFILFSPYTTFEEVKSNLEFLYKLKKLFRFGIIIEKMRILPGSKDSNLLYYDDSKIDQAYNYKIIDNKTNKYYELLIEFFKNVNVRSFEQFFTGVNLSYTILIREKQDERYNDLYEKYNVNLNRINNRIYKILVKIYNNLAYDSKDVEELLDLYSIAEVFYVQYMSCLKKYNNDIYQSIPHGMEDLNVW